VNKQGETPLDNAVANGHLSMVRKIIKLGGNVKEKGLLSTAFFSGSVPMIKEIMKYQKLKNPNTYIHSTVQSNNLNLLKFLFSLGANVNFKNKQGETPLLVALKDGLNFQSDTQILPRLLSHELHRQQPDARLHINKTRRRILKELLKKGADINMVDKKGHSPIDMAQKYEDGNVVKFLKKHSN